MDLVEISFQFHKAYSHTNDIFFYLNNTLKKIFNMNNRFLLFSDVGNPYYFMMYSMHDTTRESYCYEEKVTIENIFNTNTYREEFYSKFYVDYLRYIPLPTKKFTTDDHKLPLNSKYSDYTFALKETYIIDSDKQDIFLNLYNILMSQIIIENNSFIYTYTQHIIHKKIHYVIFTYFREKSSVIYYCNSIYWNQWTRLINDLNPLHFSFNILKMVHNSNDSSCDKIKMKGVEDLANQNIWNEIEIPDLYISFEHIHPFRQSFRNSSFHHIKTEDEFLQLLCRKEEISKHILEHFDCKKNVESFICNYRYIILNNEEKYPDQFDSEKYPDQLDGEKYPDQFDSEKYPDQFDGEKYPDQFDGEKYRDQFDSEKYRDQFDGEKYPDQFDGEKYPDQFDGEKYQDQLNGEKYPDQLNGEKYPDQFDGEIFLDKRKPNSKRYSKKKELQVLDDDLNDINKYGLHGNLNIAQPSPANDANIRIHEHENKMDLRGINKGLYLGQSTLVHKMLYIPKKILSPSQPNKCYLIVRDPIDLIALAENYTKVSVSVLSRASEYNANRQSFLDTFYPGNIKLHFNNLLNQPLQFGFQICNSGSEWSIVELIPRAQYVSLVGDFNNWDIQSHPLLPISINPNIKDLWSIRSSTYIHCESNLKLYVESCEHRKDYFLLPSGNSIYRDSLANIVNNRINPHNYAYKFNYNRVPVLRNPKIYELYIGLIRDDKLLTEFGTYKKCLEIIVPYLIHFGYNVVILIGILSHERNSFGWNTKSFFSPMEDFGLHNELKKLIDIFHKHSISVLFAVVHSHISNSPNVCYNIDGESTMNSYLHHNCRIWTPSKSIRLLDFKNKELWYFLINSLIYLYCEYNIDGFRFENIANMISHKPSHQYNVLKANKELRQNDNHHIETTPECQDSCTQSLLYLMMMNEIIHLIPGITTIASDTSDNEYVTSSVSLGGLGFDYTYHPTWFYDKVVQYNLLSSSKYKSFNLLIHEIYNQIKLCEKRILTIQSYNNSIISRRKLLIAIFSWESLHTHPIGGVSPHVTELSESLAGRGHQVHIFTRAVSWMYKVTMHGNVYYHECPFQLNSHFITEVDNMCNSFYYYFKETEIQLNQQFNICHSHDWLTAKMHYFIKPLGRCAIQTIHSTEYGRCGNRFYEGQSRVILNIEKEACHMCDRIICVSHVLASEVSDIFNINLNKIKTIYNGINLKKSKVLYNKDVLRRMYRIKSSEIVFLFVGRLVVQKGPDLLIEAIPCLLNVQSNIKFFFVGDGYMKEDLINRAKSLEIYEHCVFTGTLSGNKLLRVFELADVIVLPSRNEPFGIVVLEAWAASKPIIVTNCGGPRDFVSHGITGLLVDPTVEGIIWGCTEILNDPNHKRELGFRGRHEAEVNFSWDKLAESTEELYYEQLNNHDSSYCEDGLGNFSLAFHFVGHTMNNCMRLENLNDTAISHGIAYHKLFRLLVLAISQSGYSNFIGNEFAYPDSIDPPRGSNNFSLNHFTRNYKLSLNKNALYKYLQFFDICIMRLFNCLHSDNPVHLPEYSTSYEENIICLKSVDYCVLININPDMGYTNITYPFEKKNKIVLIFDTDDIKFGGKGYNTDYYNNLISPIYHQSNHIMYIDIHIPARTGLIFILDSLYTKIKPFLNNDKFFPLTNVDTFIEVLKSQSVTEND